jgi:hypothetical protein
VQEEAAMSENGIDSSAPKLQLALEVLISIPGLCRFEAGEL